MKPGDMIEWVYKNSNQRVYHNEQLWSSTMRCYVPIGELSLLVSITDEIYVWLNPNTIGLFHARVDDCEVQIARPHYGKIVPRARVLMTFCEYRVGHHLIVPRACVLIPSH